MIDMSMEQSSFGSKRHDEADFNLKEWTLNARISRENSNSRRFSASNLTSFREEEQRSFRSNHVTISSTASSPGYTIKDEIDPSTYSFTTALKALQAKTVYTWEYLSPDGLTLNSKWNDAEKYICNPLSGQVPLECLSAKTLSARSFRTLTSRITMSAPLIYPSNHLQPFHKKFPILQHQDQLKITIQAAEEKRGATRDVGTQSTPVDVRSSSPSPVQTPSIEERTIKCREAEDSSDDSNGKLKSKAEVEVKETSEKKEKQYTRRNEGRERKQVMWRRCSRRQEGAAAGGCLLFRGLRWHTRDKHKPKNNNPAFLYHINNTCYNE